MTKVSKIRIFDFFMDEFNIGATLKKLLSTPRFYAYLFGTFFWGSLLLFTLRNPIVYFYGDEFSVEIIETKVSEGGRTKLYHIYFNYKGKKCRSTGCGRDNYKDIMVGDVVKMRKCQYIDGFVASCSCVWLMFLCVFIFLFCFSIFFWSLYSIVMDSFTLC